MKHISILPLYDATLTSIDSSHQLFTRVNDFMRYQGKPAFYDVVIVGTQARAELGNGLYQIRTNRTIADVTRTDLVVIPLLCNDFRKAIAENSVYKDWVIEQYNAGAEIVCLCTGSFFLASTGLLNDRKCAVHWAAKDEFKALFPEVNVINDAILTDEKGIYTCGGGYAYLNLLLYVLEKHLGRETAILASKMFEIDMERKSQQPFTIFIGQKRHGDEQVLRAQELIEQNPTALFKVADVCDQLGIGRRTFERRFKKNTGNSFAEYIQRVKVEFAKQQLETGTKTVNEIIYETGYQDVDAFRKVFRKFTDLSPNNYRKKFGG
jgi:transcriptional regulator GlxA family with amidase domain